MSILSAQSIRLRLKDTPEYRRFEGWQLKIEPFVEESKQYKGMSYGLTAAGYDIRLGKIQHPERDKPVVESHWLTPGGFVLCASLERVKIPNDLQVIVHDKSSWARKGLALQNTVLEPGWEGWITLELSNHSRHAIHIQTGMPIAQLVFHQLDVPTDRPYRGKYQNQGDDPTDTILVDFPEQFVAGTDYKHYIEGYCAECGLQQFETPGGISCDNGHGGADTVTAPTIGDSDGDDGA